MKFNIPEGKVLCYREQKKTCLMVQNNKENAFYSQGIGSFKDFCKQYVHCHTHLRGIVMCRVLSGVTLRADSGKKAPNNDCIPSLKGLGSETTWEENKQWGLGPRSLLFLPLGGEFWCGLLKDEVTLLFSLPHSLLAELLRGWWVWVTESSILLQMTSFRECVMIYKCFGL